MEKTNQPLFANAATCTIDPYDRAVHYGDGLFETIAVRQDTPLFLAQHLQRLALGCRKLLIPLPDLPLLHREILQLLRGVGDVVLKLIISRGTGKRGYRQPKQIRPSYLFYLVAMPQHPKQWAHGITARFCQSRLGLNPTLAGIKHLNRLEQVLGRAEWDDDSIAEGIMRDTNGWVIEGTMSNLFVVKDGRISTPLLDKCGVAGIARQIICTSCKQRGNPVLQANISKQQVLAADELLITNAIIGVCPITRLDQRTLPHGDTGKQLQKLWAQAQMGQLDG